MMKLTKLFAQLRGVLARNRVVDVEMRNRLAGVLPNVGALGDGDETPSELVA